MSQVIISVAGEQRGAKVRADLLGDDQVSGGAGGWEEAEFGKKKNRRYGMVFRGTPAYTLTLPLGFNGISGRSESSVEAQCRRLAAWGRPRKAGGRPPKLRVTGLVRAPANAVWVIDSITWGAQMRNSSGRRVKQELELNLVQWRPPKKVKSPAAGKGKPKKKK